MQILYLWRIYYMKYSKQRMNILISINSQYVPIAQIMLTSLFKNNKYPMDIYMLHSDLTKSEIFEMESWISKFGNRLVTLNVDKKLLEKAPVNKHISIETYYRLLACELLPKNLERILYLDSDMIVNGDISELYFSDFNGKYFVVCEDKILSRKDIKLYRKLEIPLKEKYFNAGVLLYNLNMIRENVDLNNILDYINNNFKSLEWHDQDVLNHMFYDKALYADERKYNSRVCILNKDNFKERKNSVIVHFTGPKKPWKIDYDKPMGFMFWKYALCTKYRSKFFFTGLKVTIQDFIFPILYFFNINLLFFE